MQFDTFQVARDSIGNYSERLRLTTQRRGPGSLLPECAEEPPFESGDWTDIDRDAWAPVLKRTGMVAGASAFRSVRNDGGNR